MVRFARLLVPAALLAVAAAQDNKNNNNNNNGQGNNGNNGNNNGNNGGNNGNNNGNNGANGAQNQGANPTVLLPNAIQTGSFFDGQAALGADPAVQAKSTIDQGNFINFCAGKTLTNGLQITTGSCNGISKFPIKTSAVPSRQSV